MVSKLKTYRNLVSKIQRDLYNEFVRFWHIDHSGICSLINFNVVFTESSAWGAHVIMGSNFPVKLRTVENGDLIFIGLCLKQPIRLNLHTSRRVLSRTLLRIAYPYMGEGNEDLQKFIGDYDAVKGDRSLLDPAVNVVEDCVADVESSSKVSFKLKDEMFPDCPDRYLFPLIILDTLKGTANYCKSVSANTSRQGRAVFDITELGASNIRVAASSFDLRAYIEASIENKHIRAYSIRY